MKKHLIGILCLGCMLIPAILGAQEVNEDDLFSDEESVVAVEEKQDESVSEIVNLESVSFSGEIEAGFGYDITRSYLDGDTDLGDNPYSTSVDGDFLLDVRLTKGIKSFGNLEITYSPQDDPNAPDADNFQSTLKELFVDVNMNRKVYFRFGKQNLKWGRGYLWNPTDLLSEDRKDFTNMSARREGIYGLKTHVPFGTRLNLYGFVNASGANNTDEFAVAGKMEVLLPRDIEMSLSAWKKKAYEAVYGLDFATYKFQTNWWGELSLSHGDNRHRLEEQNGEYIDTQATDEWVSRFSLGFTRAFDFRDVNNRISVTGEFYYNESGYEDDMLDDETTRTQFLDGGYFEPNNYGKYYAAMFTSVSRFIITDITLNLNAIGNLSDSSFMVSSGVDYQLANNAQLSFDLRGYLGEKNREYTLEGNALRAEVSVNLQF